MPAIPVDYSAAHVPPPGKPDMYQQVLGTLRGRYKWVIILGLIGGLAGL